MAAVHDGYVLQKSIIRSPLAGHVLTQCMLQSVRARGAEVRPRYEFKRVDRGGGHFEVRQGEICWVGCRFLSFAEDRLGEAGRVWRGVLQVLRFPGGSLR